MTNTMKSAAQIDAVSGLISISRIDTLYRDQYLLRARHYLAEQLSYEHFLDLRRQRTRLANLPNLIRNAISDGDWSVVHKLSKEHELLAHEIQRMTPLQELGKAVYEEKEIVIDPFSPGMSSLPGVAKQSLSELQDEAVRQLERLSRIDREWQAFYLQRMQTLERLTAGAGSATAGNATSQTEHMKSDALSALEAGNFSQLAELAADLDGPPARDPSAAEAGSGPFSAGDQPPDYPFEFSRETIEQAGRLGLEVESVPSQHREFAPFTQFAWHPAFAQAEESHSGVMRVPELHLPQSTPEALKARVQLFATHPLINSAGIRFLPTMSAEDLLVEMFDDPEPGVEMPGSALLDALGLAHRNQLSRRQVEAALLTHGDKILQNELGLDPLEFRLVCIPPDLHLRLGLERGWGQQQIWTHFDGYLVMMDGSLLPLAGGDVRYGGIYDLLGVSRNYDSERIIVRFAVVQRRRMALVDLGQA
jgi:hypothetical protein